MKKAIILSLFAFTFALTTAAGSVRTLMAQSGAEPAPAPAETKSEHAAPASAASEEKKSDAPAPLPEAAAPAPAAEVKADTLGAPAAPADVKTEAPAAPAPAEVKTETPAAAAPSKEAAPVAPAAAPTAPAPAAALDTKATPTPSFMVRLSHKEFAKMSLKECANCHKGSGVAPTHGSDQMREHVSVARRNGKNCVDCHNQQFCLDCHKGGGIDADLRTDNYRRDYIPSTHRTDFREIHPIRAAENPQTCYRCHDSRTCSDCHAKFRGEDLMVKSHRRSWSEKQAGSAGPAHETFTADQCRSCHLNGLLPKHEWSADHAREARRNLQACQTCHSNGDICMTCHSARSGLMVNPHPRNWGAVKDKYRSKSDGKTCIKCHDRF